MEKFKLNILNKGFNVFLKIYGIGLFFGKIIYKIFLKPILFILYQMSKILPEVKPDYTVDGSGIFGKISHCIDKYIFPTKKLESEIWTEKWESMGCPVGGLNNNNN